MAKVERIPLIYEFDQHYGSLIDAIVDPTPARKPVMARPSFQYSLDMGAVPGGVLIGTYLALVIDAEFSFGVNFPNTAIVNYSSNEIYVAFVFHGTNTATHGNDYYVGLYRISNSSVLGPPALVGMSYLSSVAASLIPSFSGAKIVTACSTLSYLLSIAIASAGTGYVVGDQLTFTGGTFTRSLILQVVSIDGSGGITGASIIRSGLYGTLPANPVSQSSTTGVGTGATFNLTFGGPVDGVIIQWADPGENYAFVGVSTDDFSYRYSGDFSALPAAMLPSAEDLSGYNFFLSVDGNIWNTNVGDPTTVNGLNFTQAFSKQSTIPVGLSTHQGYLVVFGKDEVRFFYITGATNGSSVSPILNIVYGIGAMSQQTISSVNELMGFVGAGDSLGVPVYIFYPNSQVPQRVSFPYIENSLKAALITTASFITFRGHMAFSINTYAGPSYIFDIITKIWYIWNPMTITGGTSALTNACVFNNTTILIANDPGTQHFFLIAVNPAGNDINYPGTVLMPYVPIVNTSPIDFESMATKQWYLACVVGDQTAVSLLCGITYSDDTGLSFKTPLRMVDMSSQYPVTKDLGSSRRRMWQLQLPADPNIRVDSLEIAVNIDSSQQ